MRVIRCCRTLLIAVMACLGVTAAHAQAGGASEASTQTILHLLDYVSVEYPNFVQDGKVTNEAEYAEQVEFSGQVAQMASALPAGADRDKLVTKTQQLASLIRGKQSGAKVTALARELQQQVISAYHVAVAPAQPPDLTAAPALFAANCAACHGAQGDGAGLQAADLNPKPANFHDRARQSERSVFALYNTISLGVAGTSMAAFSTLDQQDRWKLAFYVSQFSATDAQRVRGASAWKQGDGRVLFPNLAAVVTTTPAEAAQHGAASEAILAFLRTEPTQFAVDAPSPIDFSAATLARSLSQYRNGNATEAYQLAVTAYLEGFELVEASLDNRDHELRNRTEAAMMAYRNAVKAQQPIAEVDASYQAAVQLLNESQHRLSSANASPTADFISSLVIILREGLEAILVLAAMAAFLVRTGRSDALPWLHGGWIVALLLGGLTWVVSSKLIAISGAQREVTEGLTALVSAALLLYVGFWLHSRSNAARWGQFIRDQMNSAMTGSALWSIALVSFLAVYREVFETVLFYQALWLQSDGIGRTSIIGGLAIGLVALAVIAWLIAKFSIRLPLNLFFGVSSILLTIMAVVFAGQGIAALQEAGKLSANRIDVPSIPLLGIYPNVQGIALQVTLVAIIIGAYVYLNRRQRT